MVDYRVNLERMVTTLINVMAAELINLMAVELHIASCFKPFIWLKYISIRLFCLWPHVISRHGWSVGWFFIGKGFSRG